MAYPAAGWGEAVAASFSICLVDSCANVCDGVQNAGEACIFFTIELFLEVPKDGVCKTLTDVGREGKAEAPPPNDGVMTSS